MNTSNKDPRSTGGIPFWGLLLCIIVYPYCIPIPVTRMGMHSSPITAGETNKKTINIRVLIAPNPPDTLGK
jgi:hypothetical protein